MRFQTLAMTAVMFGMAGLAMARGPMIPTGTPVEIKAAIETVRVVPATDPFPGMHVDMRVKGRLLDVYIAPMSFVTKYGVKLGKGQYAEVIGTQTEDLVVARSVTTGIRDKSSGVFHEDMTIYLRDETGLPLWVEEPAAPTTSLH